MGVLKADNGRPLFADRDPNKVSETTLSAGNSPLTIDLIGTIGHPCRSGYLINDGAGTILVQEATDLAISKFNTAHTLKTGEVLTLTGSGITAVKLTRGTGDAAFRLNAW